VIGLDTNVMARYIMRDDLVQTPLADSVLSSLTARDPGFLSLVVLVELWWVLGRAYGRTTGERLRLFKEILDTDELRVESEQIVTLALAEVGKGADFADSLIGILAQKVGCRTTVTFDREAARHPGMTLLNERR